MKNTPAPPRCSMTSLSTPFHFETRKQQVNEESRTRQHRHAEPALAPRYPVRVPGLELFQYHHHHESRPKARVLVSQQLPARVVAAKCWRCLYKGVGAVLLDRDAWSIVRWPRQATNKYVPRPPPAPPRSFPATHSVRNVLFFIHEVAGCPPSHKLDS